MAEKKASERRWLKAIRAMLKLNLEMVSESTGISKSMISAIERGERKITDETAQKLADCYGVPKPTIMTGEGFGGV